MRLSRTENNFIVDALALLALSAVIWTRIMTFSIVPAEAADGGALAVWGGGHEYWDRINFWTTMVLAAVVLLHLILHWTWVTHFVHHRIKRFTGGKKPPDSGTQTVYGVAFMIVVFCVLGGALMLAAIMAKPA